MITEDSKILAEYLDWKYIPFNDLQNYPKAGWWKKSKSLNKRSYFVNEGYAEYIVRKHSELRFYNSYDWLFKVIKKLESEELEDYMYSWEDERGMNYNFNGIRVDRMGDWDVSIHLELDPAIVIGEARLIKDDKEQLFSVLVAAVKKVNEIKTESRL